MARYRVFKYKNVRSTKQGWIIGELVRTDTVLDIDSKTTGTDLCKELKELKFVPSTSTLRTIQFSDLDSELIEVKQKKDLKPLCRLETTKC